MSKLDLNNLSLEEMKEYMLDLGQQSYRGEQLFTSINRDNIKSFNQAKLLPKSLREELEEKASLNKMEILERFDSKIDDTKKYLFLLEDKHIIESVFMAYDYGNSLCVSSQVGCRMACRFCASTKGGRVRDLSTAEMLKQLYLIEEDLGLTISNMVLMGSGEPLDNYDNVIKFLKILHDPKGKNISYRNMTLSTCGLVPQIYNLAEEGLPITLSISLHSPFDEERMKIMPITKRYGVEDIVKASFAYVEKTKRRISYEYTLIEGKNDREKDADQLIKLTKGLNLHINLIPLNPIKEYNEARPSNKGLDRFKNYLKKAGISVTIRKEKGLDISGSCGQLRNDYQMTKNRLG